MERIYWTDEMIATEIKAVMSALNINRMPSNNEIVNVRKSTDLSNIITKRGGFYKWAENLNLPTKESDTKTGSTYELYAMATMISKGFLAERMSFRHPYDLLVNKSIKVDVKVSKAYWLRGSSLVNTVGLGKKFATCDLYLIYLLAESGELDRTLIIPGHEVRHKYLNIGKHSKYNKYVDRWDLFQVYDSLKENLKI